MGIKRHLRDTLAGAASVAAMCVPAAEAPESTFPEGYEKGMHYATVERGGIREELFTSQAAIEAVKKGQSIPDGTVITMEDYREGKLYRYITMEKRSGWGRQYPDNVRTGDWRFTAFQADKSVNRAENPQRCMGCHLGQADKDFVFTLDRMRQ